MTESWRETELEDQNPGGVTERSYSGVIMKSTLHGREEERDRNEPLS